MLHRLTYILLIAMTMFLASCFPEGDDDSVMGAGSKLTGSWLEAERAMNTTFYVFEPDGTCTYGIANSSTDSVPTQPQQGTWYVEHEGLVTITTGHSHTQTYDYFANRDHLELDGREYRRVTLTLKVDTTWNGKIEYPF